MPLADFECRNQYDAVREKLRGCMVKIGLAEGVSRHHGSSRAMRLTDPLGRPGDPPRPQDCRLRPRAGARPEQVPRPGGPVSRSGEGVLGGVGEKRHGVSRWGPHAVHEFAVSKGVLGPIRDLSAMDQNTTARRIGWVESNVLSNSFSNSRVKWCPSFLISRKRSSSRFDLSSVSKCFRFAGSPKISRKRL